MKTVVAVILGTVTQFLLGWLIYGMMLMDYMGTQMIEYEGLMAEEGPGMMVAYVVSSLTMALLLTYVIKRGKASAGEGALVGLIVSLLMAIGLNTMFYYGWNLFTGTYLVVDAIVMAIMSAITGLVIGAVLGRKSSPDPAKEAQP